MKKIIFLLALLSVSLPVFAVDEITHIPNTYPTVGRSIRALGMGNAFLTTPKPDVNAPYYNPATIWDFSNKVTWATGLLPVPPFEASYSIYSLTRDVFNFKDDLDKQNTASGKINVFQNFVDQHVGSFNQVEIRLPLISAYNKYFYTGIISDDDFGVSFRNRAFPNFEIKATSYSGLALGGAYAFFDERLELGAMVKALYGIENQRVITSADILANNFDDFRWSNWKRGLGVGFDAGFKYTIHDFGSDIMDTLKPTIAAAWQNIGNTKFRWMKKNDGPTKIQQSLSAGVGIHPIFGVVETSLMVDFREINLKEDFLLRLNAGAEVRLPSVLLHPSFRVGTNQGYPAFGAGINVGVFTWHAAFYGVELGETTREKCGWRFANEFIWAF